VSTRGGVRRSAVHNTPPGDAPAIDAGTDTLTTNCITDEFAGTALDAHWSTLVGALPPTMSTHPACSSPMPRLRIRRRCPIDRGSTRSIPIRATRSLGAAPPSNDRGYGRAVSGGERCEGARPSRRATDPGGVA